MEVKRKAELHFCKFSIPVKRRGYNAEHIIEKMALFNDSFLFKEIKESKKCFFPMLLQAAK